MKQKHFVVLVIAALLLVVAALWSSRTGNGDKTIADGGLLLPGLRAQVDNVTDIRVVTRGNDDVAQIALQKKDGQWIVADKNHRADTQKLSALVSALVQAKRIETKTAKAEHHVRLGVVDPTQAADGAGKLVRLLQADGAPLAEVVLGSVATGRKGQYARLANESQVWLIDQSADVPATAAAWLDRQIADINGADITAVDFGGVKLQRAGDDKPLQLVAMPAGRELTYDGVTAAAAQALSSLQLQDVTTADAAALPKPVATAVFTTTAKATVTVTAYRRDDRNYLTLRAAALEQADDAARKQVETWNAAWLPWVYEVDTYTYNKFVKTLNDFTKEKAKPQKAG